MTRSCERGFGITEMLASIAIMAGALLVCFDLIDESMRVFGEADQAAKDQITLAGEMSLRRDLQAAVVYPAEQTKSNGPLELVLNNGTRVSWRRHGSTLFRHQTPPDGDREEALPIIRNLTRWQWEIVGPSLIEVRFRRAVPPPISGLPKAGPPDRKPETREYRIVASPRSAGRIGSW